MTTPDIDTVLAWRGRTVLDRDGRKVGRLDELYLDAETDRPAWAAVHTGLFGLRRSLLPLAGAHLAGDDVQVPYDGDLIKDAPKTEPDVALSEDEEALLYRHYGIADDLPATVVGGDAGRRDDTDVEVGRSLERPDERPTDDHRPATTEEDRELVAPDERDAEGSVDRPGLDHAERGRPGEAEQGISVVRSEEEVHVGKRQASSRLRLKKYVVTEEEAVPVRREEVRIERVPEGEGGDAEVVFDSGDADGR